MEMTPTEQVADYLAGAGLAVQQPDAATFVVEIPGEHKLRTTVSIRVGDHSVSVNAFVARHPDENHAQVYRWLLQRNQRMGAACYAVDHLGDIYLTARIPLSDVSPQSLDRVIGTIAQHADGDFNPILERGFATAIRKEWRWRRSRGESTANLAAFRGLAPDQDPAAADSAVSPPGVDVPESPSTRHAGGVFGHDGPMTSDTMNLILLRHGQSDWNAKNLFTGWVDVDLTDTGREEAHRGGELLAQSGLHPDVVHTSLLRRAIRTAQIALHAADRQWIGVRRHWRLNERHYGALQGKNKAETLQQYGEAQFMQWRRSYDVPPPPIDAEDPWAQTHDPKYARLAPEQLPATECLADVVDRMLPYWYDAIVPDLRDGKTVLVTAHGNSLRALVKHLDGISDADIVELNIPTGIPLAYTLDADLRPTVPGGQYLDPAAAAAAAAAVAAQGKK
jgi:2,3-bisphosphoglycerate-dependent phosphoglycerate mutase